jgi:hypothetical protein
VADYSNRILENLARMQPISDIGERDIFTNNLGEKTQVEILKPATLDAAMDLAISFENLNTVTGAMPTRSAKPPAWPHGIPWRNSAGLSQRRPSSSVQEANLDQDERPVHQMPLFQL